MRRPLNWLVFALSLGFLAMGRALQSPSPPPAPAIIERTPVEPRVAVAIPAPLRRHADLEFGYVDRDR
jgi:hypothetical protein